MPLVPSPHRIANKSSAHKQNEGVRDGRPHSVYMLDNQLRLDEIAITILKSSAEDDDKVYQLPNATGTGRKQHYHTRKNATCIEAVNTKVAQEEAE